jgi:MFS family permease
LLNGLQAIPSWQTFFGRPTGIHLGLISASFYLPKVILAWVAPWVNDRYGRKVPLWIAVVLMIAGSVWGGFCQSTGQLVGARILVGAGTSFGSIGAVTLVPELAHPRLRHQAGAFLWTTFFIGSICAAWVAFGMTHYPDRRSDDAWRIPMFLQAVGPCIMAAGLWFVPSVTGISCYELVHIANSLSTDNHLGG